MNEREYALRPVGVVRSPLQRLDAAPRQGSEGAPEAWLEIDPPYADAIAGLAPEDVVLVLTWLHHGDRHAVQVHPRDDPRNPRTGVFATRSQDRPNPIGLHRVVVREIVGCRLRVHPLEAVDGTPVLDIKPVLADEG